MLEEVDFENVVWDFLFTYRQLLLNGYLHERVNSDAYQKNSNTWDTILVSLEAGVVLGLARLLEEKYFGREFEDIELKSISDKIIKIRKSLVAHNDLAKMRNRSSFLERNQLTGTDLIKMIDVLKSRAVQYQKKFSAKMDVQKLFKETTRNTIIDLDNWLKSFQQPL